MTTALKSKVSSAVRYFMGMTNMNELRTGVTVVATFYNKEYCTRQVLSCIQRQSIPVPLELILVDDGSSDGTLRSLIELSGNFENILILTQKNAGPSSALNLGLGLSRTIYTKGLDGDDLLVPDAIGLLLNALDDNPTCRWAYGVGGNYPDFPPDLDTLFSADSEARKPAVVIHDQLRRTIKHSHTNPSAWLAQTAYLNQIGFCDPRIFVQDYSIELRMAAFSAAAFSPNIVYYSHQQILERNLSFNRRQGFHDGNLSLLNLFQDYRDLIPDHVWYGAQRAAGRAWHWARRHEGKTITSKEYLRFLASRLRLGDPLNIIAASCNAFGGSARPPGNNQGAFEVVLAKGSFQAAA